MAREQYQNNYTTTLNGAIDNTVTTIAVGAAPSGMTGNFRIKIDDEIILVGAVSGSDFTGCTRGVEGTTAASHSNGASVKHILTKAAAQLLAPSVYDGLRGEWKAIPASPNTDDREFDTTTLGGSALGSPNIIDADTTLKSHLYIRSTATSGLDGRIWAHTFSAGEYIETELSMCSFDANASLAGLTVTAASPGVCIVAGIIAWGSNDLRMYAAKYSSPTAWSADIYALASPELPGVSSYALQFVKPRFRIKYNSDTSLDIEYSLTQGAAWFTMATAFNGSFTPGAIGLFCSRNTGTGTDAHAAFDSIRVHT